MHKPVVPPFYKPSLILNIENVSASKKVTAHGSIGSKSNKNLMKSFQNNIPGSEVKKSKTGKRPGYNK